MCIGLSWNLQAINKQEKTRQYGLFCQINNNAYKSHFNNLIMVFSYRPPKKRKEIKLFTRESSQQAKEEQEIFLGFLFNYYYSMESKLIKSYNYFFGFF